MLVLVYKEACLRVAPVIEVRVVGQANLLGCLKVGIVHGVEVARVLHLHIAANTMHIGLCTCSHQ